MADRLERFRGAISKATIEEGNLAEQADRAGFAFPYLYDESQDVARAYGYEKEAEEIQDLYLSGKKKEAEAHVPLELLEMCNLVGPESYVKERIDAFLRMQFEAHVAVRVPSGSRSARSPS